MTFDWDSLPWVAISFAVAGAAIYLGVVIAWAIMQLALRIVSGIATRRARRRRAKAMRQHPSAFRADAEAAV